MLAYPLAALLLLGGSSTTAAGRPAGKLNQKQFLKELYGTSKSSRALRKKFISKSKFVGVRGERKLDQDSYPWENGYMSYTEWFEATMKNNGGNNDNNGNGNNNNNYNQANNADEGEEEIEYEWMKEFGFQPSQYALSYHRCAAVQQFDDEVAAARKTSSALATKNFAIFRFCPADSCDAGADELKQWSEIERQEAEAEENGQYNNGYYNNGGRKLQYANNYQAQNAAAQGEGQEPEEVVIEDGARYSDSYGARGRGCNSNYGEYMIELEDYLQIMKEHQEERVEAFCEFCEEYMWELYEQCLQKGGCRRNLKFDEFKDPNGFHARVLGGIEYGSCILYPDMCNNAIDDHLTEYFECKEVGGAYVGPHCADDGYTVTLGVYADEDCNVYTGDDVETVLGEELEKDALKSWYNSRDGTLDLLFEGKEAAVCIPCGKMEDDFEQMFKDYGNNDDDQAANAYEEEEEVDYENDDINEICETMFESSARCHKNYQSFRKGNLSSEQWKEMQLSCNYIESIANDNYDEMGYVNLKSNWNFKSDDDKPEWARDNKYISEYGKTVSDVSPLQVFFLVFAILACIILAVWSKTLHSSLVKKDQWAPGRKWTMKSVFRKGSSPEIGPSESGIGASRVRSGGDAAYYLS